MTGLTERKRGQPQHEKCYLINVRVIVLIIRTDQIVAKHINANPDREYAGVDHVGAMIALQSQEQGPRRNNITLTFRTAN